jgi:hypothetical protein
MKQATPLADLFKVKTRFRRSINIAADLTDSAVLEDYILTQNGRDILRRLGEGLRPESQNRAWSITGPYGAGKSAFALFLLKLLGYGQGAEARELLRTADPQVWDELQQVSGLADGGFVVVPVVGNAEPLPLAVLRGLRETLRASEIQGRQIKGLLAELTQQCEAIANGQAILPGLFTETIERVARAVRAADEHCLGLLFVIDELGKLLEYAALHPDKSDVFDLQSLAELASRSREATIGVIVILHQAFEHYAARLTSAQRQEWSKVQGRYEDIGFLEPQSELLRLIGTAIQPGPPLDGLADTIADEVSRASDIIPRELGAEEAQHLLRRCAPLHPTVALLLGRLFHSRLAQNERSLFAFLSSGEPCGFQDYLRQASWAGDGERPFYRLDQLYDYVLAALGSGLYTDRRWAEIGYALDRLPKKSPPLAARLVKAIGLLGIAGDQQYLKASPEMLAYALADEQDVTTKQVRTALQRLVEQRIVIYRGYREAYGLWEGSDVDLGERYRRALEQVVDRSTSLASLLQDCGDLRPYIAKRHLHETGTLRYFAPWVIDVDGLDAAFERPFGPADGAIVFVLDRPGVSPDQTLKRVLEATSRLEYPRKELLFFAIPKDTSGLREAMEEVQAWEWVAKNTPELDGDRIAYRELRGFRDAAKRRLEELCRRCFDKSASYASAFWVWKGEQRQPRSSRELAKMLSDACQEADCRAPIVRNELINRRTLSSAATAARHKLLDRMLSCPGEPRLGINGHPPELSMYRSVFERTGLHHPTERGWAFGLPDGPDEYGLTGLWEGIREFLATTEGGRRPVSELYETLRQPPYGIRDGLLPIYLAAAVLSWGTEIALYENGTYVAVPTTTLMERLARVPWDFAIQRYPLDSTRWYVLRRYLLIGDEPPEEGATLLSIVRPIITLVHDLPAYSRQTKRITPAAVAVREAVLQAREPHVLLFETLPLAVGMQPIRLGSDESLARQFFDALNDALQELRSAYDVLLSGIREELLSVMGVPPDLEVARQIIAQRLLPLRARISDQRLQVFAQRLGDTSLQGDAWLESVASCLTGKPPRSWSDEDLLRFGTELAGVVDLLTRIEGIVRAASEMPDTDMRDATMLLLDVTRDSGEGYRRVAYVLAEEQEQLQTTVRTLAGALRSLGVSDRIAAAAIADLTAGLLTPTSHDGREHDSQQ